MEVIKEALIKNPNDILAKSQLVLSENLGDWVGILFGIYNGVSAIFALLIPRIARKIGNAKTHMMSLMIGGIGLMLMYFMPNKNAMIFPMLFIGIAWASILAMPYSMLSGAIPAERMGIFMGIFNFFITLPQIVSALFSGPMVKYLFGGNAVYALVLGGILMIVAGLLCVFVQKEQLNQPEMF
jgi:maltose/moltooligosaccharide transporter